MDSQRYDQIQKVKDTNDIKNSPLRTDEDMIGQDNDTKNPFMRIESLEEGTTLRKRILIND